MDLNTYDVISKMEDRDKYRFFNLAINQKILNREGDIEQNKEILRKIRHGIKINFDFEDMIKNKIEERCFKRTVNGKEVGKTIKKLRIGKSEWITEDQLTDEYYERINAIMLWVSENIKINKPGTLLNQEEAE